MSIILKGTVITPSEQIDNGIVIVDAGKITAVGPSKDIPAPENSAIKNFGKKFICPGFIDVHVQGAGGCDVLDGNYEALNTIKKTLAKSGTTAFLATTVVSGDNKHLKIVAETKDKGADGASVLGIHLEGPFINPAKRGMIRPENVKIPDRKLLKRILDVSLGKLKMMTIAPEIEGSLDIIKELVDSGIVASIGHSLSTYQEAKAGFDAGISHATHMFNAMSTFHHRQPQAAGAILTDDRVSVQMISDGAHLHPATVRLLIKVKGIEKIALITDSMSALGLPDGRYIYNGIEYESKDGLAKYRDGTFIGTALGLNNMIKRVMEYTGIEITDAVRMASLSPAQILAIADRKGSLEVGKDADIVVMDKDCNVEMVMIGGRIIRI